MVDIVAAGAGAVVGFFVGGPQGALYGAQIGFSLGTAIKGSDEVIQGPKIGEVAAQNSKEGIPRPIVFGVARPIGGNIIASGKPIITTITESSGGGKNGGGGPEVEREEVHRTYAIRICEGPVSGVRRVWRDNKLVYDSRAQIALDILQQAGAMVMGTEDVWVVDPNYTGPTTVEYQYDGKGPITIYTVEQVANANTTGRFGEGWARQIFDSNGAYITQQQDTGLEPDPNYSGDETFGYTAKTALAQVENNEEFLKVATFHLGEYDQMPDPALEAEFGVENVTAHRGTCYMVMDTEDLTPRRGSIPQYVFEVARGEGFWLTTQPYPVEVGPEYLSTERLVGSISLEQVYFPPLYSEYAMLPEYLSTNRLVGDMSMQQLLKTYPDALPEYLATTRLVGDMSMQQLAKTYHNYPPEYLSTERLVGDMSMDTLANFYTYYAPEYIGTTRLVGTITMGVP